MTDTININREMLKKASFALDLAQALLVKSYYHKTILTAYKELAAALAAPQPQAIQVTEEMHRAAVKVLIRASGLDGLPQRMVNAMLAAQPVKQAPEYLAEAIRARGTT